MAATHLPGTPPSLRIFVVENHPDTLTILTLYLEAMGHTVTTATTMTEALAQLPRRAWDVLLSDIGLSDGDGWELLRRAGPMPTLYAIAMSGFGRSTDHLKSRDAGYRQHLVKPFQAGHLEAALDEAARELPNVPLAS